MNLNDYSQHINKLNEKWWFDIETGQPLKRNVGELLMLCVSELAEAMEGDRKDLMDDKLPEFKMFDVEIADTFIRLFDICGARNIDIEAIIKAKLEYNKNREDHRVENRLKAGGKKY
ncbi:MAG: hypothetical protein ACRD9Q_00490 [Nitrososphaeraceae archaeon]